MYTLFWADAHATAISSTATRQSIIEEERGKKRGEEEERGEKRPEEGTSNNGQ